MRWRDEDGVRWLEAELPGARVAFSTRVGGVSDAPYDSLNLAVLTGDRREDVRENRHRLARAIGVDPERVLIGRQVHGAEIAHRDAAPRPSAFADPGPELPEADGQVTAVPGLAATFADKVEGKGFERGAVTNSSSSFATTVVMFKRGHKPEARKVAKQLQISKLQLMTGEIESASAGAPVAVIVGEDNAEAAE